MEVDTGEIVVETMGGIALKQRLIGLLVIGEDF